MKDRFDTRLNPNDQAKHSIIYKYHKIPIDHQTEFLRKIVDREVERILHGSQDEKHLGHEEEVRLLEGWDCNYRTLIWPYNRHSKKKEPRIFCFNPMTREVLKTNELYIAVCKNCHESGRSTTPLLLPEPKKQVSKPTPKRQSKPVKERDHQICKTKDCDNVIYRGDIKGYPKWMPDLCPVCYTTSKSPRYQGQGLPLQGSPADIRKKEAEKRRRGQTPRLHGLEARTKAKDESDAYFAQMRKQQEHDALSAEIQNEIEHEKEE